MPYVSDSIIESLRQVGGDVGRTLVKDIAQQVPVDAVTSILGTHPQDSGELKINQEIFFHPPDRASERPTMPNARPEVISRPQIQLVEKGLKESIEAVRIELKAISASMKSLNADIAKAVNEVPVNPGVYHLNFFERLKSVLAIIRTQIDDSRSWLLMWGQRKAKRGYWNMFKKHGTKFGLSSERTAATSAG